MSYLRDAKYIKIIAESSGFKEPSEEACRFILSDIELTLRDIIFQAKKYSQKFRKRKIGVNEVKHVLEDMNLTYLTQGTLVDSVNEFVFNKASGFY